MATAGEQAGTQDSRGEAGGTLIGVLELCQCLLLGGVFELLKKPCCPSLLNYCYVFEHVFPFCFDNEFLFSGGLL